MEAVEGRVAVITGAASGIGLGLARRFGADGMKLVLADIDGDGLALAADELRADGIEVATQLTDVSDGEQVDALGAAALAAFGSVHLVCNNAGVGGGGQIDSLTTADWEWVLGVNLWGVIHGMRVFLPMLVEQGEGHIVNTASVAGLFSAPFMGPYNASKSAVVALSETAFNELALAGSDVGISVLCPSWVQTRIHESARNRPAHLQNEATDDAVATESLVAAAIEGFIAGGLSPDDVAAQVAAAVAEKRFYILTHPDSKKAVRARMEAILADEPPPFLMPE